SLPPHTQPPGERGLEKARISSFQSPSSPRAGGREAGEEGRGGEGPRRRGYSPIEEDLRSGYADFHGSPTRLGRNRQPPIPRSRPLLRSRPRGADRHDRGDDPGPRRWPARGPL